VHEAPRYCLMGWIGALVVSLSYDCSRPHNSSKLDCCFRFVLPSYTWHRILVLAWLYFIFSLIGITAPETGIRSMAMCFGSWFSPVHFVYTRYLRSTYGRTYLQTHALISLSVLTCCFSSLRGSSRILSSDLAGESCVA
jgi:hypothetical protein